MKVLITGALGLLGSACMEYFAGQGWEVVGIDNNARSKNLKTKKIERNGVRMGNIAQNNSVIKNMTRHQFDAVIHCAAQPSHDFSNNNVILDFDTNARGTVLLLEATRKYSPNAVFVYISTDKVYGENMHLEMDELGQRYSPLDQRNLSGFKEDLGLDFAGHRSPFGVSKLAGDLYAQEYACTFGLKTGIFRPGCITGKNHEGAELHGFLAYLAKCIRTETPYKIFGYKGKQVRDQIHSMDLASGIYEFVQNPRPGEVYNIGGGPERSVSILEAIELIEKEVGKKAIVEHHKPRPGDRVWDVHDVSKFKSHYPNWEYKYSLQDIIKDVCQKEL